MSTSARLAAFVAGLVVAFGAAYGVGDAVEPVLDAPVQDEGHDMSEDEGHGGGTDHDQ